MARCSLSLLALAAVVLLASASPVPSKDKDSQQDDPFDILDGRTRRLAPDMADPLPPARHPTRALRRAEVRAKGSDPYRLPTNLIPILYQVQITPNFSTFRFSGESLIVVNCNEDTNKIVMHSKQIVIDEESLTIYDDRTTSGWFPTTLGSESVVYDTEHDFVTITMSKKLVAGGRYRITFSYTGILNDDLDGFYRSSYKTSSGELRWLGTTQFEQTGARRAFPCWDEPSFKARFYIIITADQTRNVVSNMPVVQSDRNRDNSTTVQFDGTLPISTYLIAFIVSDFEKVSNADRSFSTYARHDLIKGANVSQWVGQKALQLLAEYNGIPYALPKEDQAAIPDFAAGAMENWGLVTYREEYLMEQDTQTIRIKEYMYTTICHELGHQWTGDLVTLDWWAHTWLNEGFADYFESFICNKIEPTWNLRDKYIVSDHQRGMESDALETQHAMSSPVSTPTEDDSKFDRISYSKGGAVIRMWEYMIGLDVLKAGMHRYLTIHMFKNTNPEDLFGAIDFEVQKAGALPAGVSFNEIARTWTEQPGVPVVTAIRDYTKKSLSLSQQRFFYQAPSRAGLLRERWYIPVTVREQGSTDWDNLKPTTFLKPDVESTSIDVAVSSGQWVLVNPKEIGYYRVNYDVTNWNLLAKAITANPSTFPAGTRVQLINDAMALARAKQLDYAVALQFLPFLKKEREVAPWQSAVTVLSYLRSKLAGTDAWPAFLTLLQQLTAPTYSEVKFSGSSDNDARYLRYYLSSYACYAGNADCISNANNVLKAWLADSSTKLDPDTKDVAMCFGLRGADAASNFEGLKAKWLAEKDPTVRLSLLTSLACAQEDHLNSLLMDAINFKLDGVDEKEVVSMWPVILDRPERVDFLLKFTKDNHLPIDLYFINSSVHSGSVSLLSKCIAQITSTEALDDVRWWVEDNFKNRPGYAVLQTAFLDAYESLDWYRSNYNAVASWLQTAASA